MKKKQILSRGLFILASLPMFFIFFSVVFKFPIGYFIFMFLFLLLGIGIYTQQRKKKELHEAGVKEKYSFTIFFSIAFLVYIILQILVGTKITVNPGWDFGTMYYNAQAYVLHGVFEAPESIARFPHNDLLLSVYIVYFKILTMFNIPITVNAVLGLNLLFIDGTILCLYFTAKKLWGAQKSFWVGILSFAFIPLLAYSPILYTDTASMPFVSLVVFMEVLLIKVEPVKYGKKWFAIVLLQGVFLAVGYLFKATVVIIGVAIVIVVIFQMKSVYIWKDKLIRIVSMAVAFVLVVGVCQFIFYQTSLTSKEGEELYSFPATHWVMMGLKGNGGFDQQDADFTMSFATKEEKQKANLEEIQTRLADMGVSGYLQLLNRKAVYTWGDGTYYSSAKLAVTPLHDGILAQVFRLDGKYNFVYQLYANAYQVLLLFGLLVAYIFKIKKPKLDFWAVLLFSITGVAIFLLIWEDRSRYLLNFFPVLLLFSLYGYSVFFRKAFCVFEQRNKMKNR